MPVFRTLASTAGRNRFNGEVLHTVRCVVNVEIRYFDGCPNWRIVAALVRRLLAETQTEADVRLMPVETPGDAERLAFRGSPTVLLNGTDPWENPDTPVGLSCRVYRTELGYAGSPSESQLREAIQAAKDT